MNHAPFELPPDPVDRYRVEWWEVDPRGIDHREAVYHVHSKWRDVCPEREPGGADFVDHWQLFTNGQFTGRSADGWRALEDFPWDARCLASWSEAKIVYRGLLKNQIRLAQERIDECQRRLKRFRSAKPPTFRGSACS